MATGVTDKAGRQKVLEGLWLIGIEPTQLGIDPALDTNAFLDALHRNGVNDDFIRRAIAGTDWRAPSDNQPLVQKVAELLRVSGYRQDEVDLFFNQAQLYGPNDPKAITNLLTQQFNERTAGAMIYKATGGKDVAGAVWNPYRTDTPPKGADVKFGGGGMMQIPAGWQATEPRNPQIVGAPGQPIPASATAGVPTPPPTVRKTPANQPGAPALSGQTPGPAAGGTPGAGPGAGGTPPAKPLTPDQIKADIQSRYGWGAALMDIPEIAAILNRVGSGPGQINAEEANRLWLASDYYRSTSTNQRNWKVLQGTNPGDAAYQLQGQVDSITARAQAQGIQITPERIRQIAEVSKANGWSDQDINRAIASEIHWDPTGTKTGTMATLKAAAQNQLVPMSDTAMTQWAQAVVSGAKTVDDFNAYLKDQAKSLFPTMATYLDTTPGGNVKTYLSPYSETIGKTLGMNPNDIDWMDPKWYRFVNASDAKTGERKVIDIADVQRTLIADPTYNYDQTANGKQQKAGLARSILQDWGFIPNSGGGLQ